MKGRTNAVSGGKELQYASGKRTVGDNGTLAYNGLAFQPVAVAAHTALGGGGLAAFLLADKEGNVLRAQTDERNRTEYSSVTESGFSIYGAEEDITYYYYAIGY